MAALNLEKAVEKGYKIMDSRYCLRHSDIKKLGQKNNCNAVLDAFAIGYLQGTKAAKREMAKVKQ